MIPNERIRWRNANGAIVGGLVQGFDPERREYTVIVPQWLDSETYNVVGTARVAEADAVLGDDPWPDGR